MKTAGYFGLIVKAIGRAFRAIANFFAEFFNRNMVDTYNHQLNRRTKNRDY